MSDLKVCQECNLEQPIENFSFKNKLANKRQRECKECHKAHIKKYYANNKQKHLEAVKIRRKAYKLQLKTIMNALKSQPCTDCKISYIPYVMDFDHLRDKEYEISNMVKDYRPIEAILNEIKKCDLVCSNCHRIRTYNRRSDSCGI